MRTAIRTRSDALAVAALASIYVLALVAAHGPVELRWSPTLAVYGALSLGLGAALVRLSLIDWATLRLPDRLTLPLLGAGLVLVPGAAVEDYAWRAVGAASGYALLAGVAWAHERWRGRQGLGLGDAKLFAAGGAWLGIEALPMVLLGASLFALAYVAVMMVRGATLTREMRLPFGPFLAFAIWLVWCLTLPQLCYG